VLNDKDMKTLIKFLTIVVRLVGVLLLFFGLIVGVIGVGPDTVSTTWRWIGIGVGVVGGLYWIPYQRVTSNKLWTTAYLFGVSLPVLLMAFSLIQDINTGLDKDAVATAMTIIGIMSLAPATLLLRIKIGS